MSQIDEAKNFARLLFEPREQLSIPEWAEKNLTLSARVTNIPGAYSTTLTPYVREPLEAFGDDSIRRVVLVWVRANLERVIIVRRWEGSDN